MDADSAVARGHLHGSHGGSHMNATTTMKGEGASLIETQPRLQTMALKELMEECRYWESQSQLAVAQQQEAEALLEQTQSFLLEAIKSLRSYAVHLENKLSDEKGNLAVDEATCSIMKRADQDLARALIVPQLVEEHFRGRGSGASSDSMDGGLVSRLAKAEQVSLKACQALVERQAKDIEGLRTELAEAKQELKASAAAATRCSGENTGLQEELATAASELATLRQMETQLKRSLEDKEALYQRLYEHAEGLEQELEDNERAMREKELQLGETKKSLRAAQARTEELEAELMEAQGAAARLQQATALNKELEMALHGANDTQQDMAGTMEALQRKLSGAEDTVHRLKLQHAQDMAEARLRAEQELHRVKEAFERSNMELKAKLEIQALQLRSSESSSTKEAVARALGEADAAFQQRLQEAEVSMKQRIKAEEEQQRAVEQAATQQAAEAKERQFSTETADLKAQVAQLKQELQALKRSPPPSTRAAVDLRDKSVGVRAAYSDSKEQGIQAAAPAPALVSTGVSTASSTVYTEEEVQRRLRSAVEAALREERSAMAADARAADATFSAVFTPPRSTTATTVAQQRRRSSGGSRPDSTASHSPEAHVWTPPASVSPSSIGSDAGAEHLRLLLSKGIQTEEAGSSSSSSSSNPSSHSSPGPSHAEALQRWQRRALGAEEEVERLQAALEEVEGRAAAAERRAASLQAKEEVIEERLAAAMTELDNVNIENRRLKRSLEAAAAGQETAAVLQRQLSDAEERIKELTKEKAALKGQVAQLKKEVVAVQRSKAAAQEAAQRAIHEVEEQVTLLATAMMKRKERDRAKAAADSQHSSPGQGYGRDSESNAAAIKKPPGV